MNPPIRTASLSRSFLLILAPLLFLGLTFVQRIVFLRDIRGPLLLISGLGVVWLLAAFLAELKRDSIEAHLDSLPARRLSWRLFLLGFLIYGLYATGLIFPALPFTGDEPHYLLITRSLITDGDLNLAEDYRDREYKAFYDGELDLHAHPGKRGERFLYSKHLPALPVLIAPFYIAGEKAARLVSSLTPQAGGARTVLVFFSRLPICLLTALLGFVFFLSAWELTRKKSAALLAWLIFSFSSPLLFYSHLIYPEVPVALILAGTAYGFILQKRISSRYLFWTGVGIGLLPWFGIKYIPLAGAAFLIAAFLAARRGRIQIKAAVSLLAPLVVSAGLFVLFLYSQYGRISLQAVYRGTAKEADLSISRFLAYDLSDFLSRLPGHLLDQRIGLFIYAPIWILSLAGFFLMVKKKSKPAYLLAGLFAAFWIFCSLTRYWGGFCPPGRPLLPVLWVPALFLAAGLANERNKIALVIRNGLIVLSFFLVFVALHNPRLLYQDSMSFLVGPGHPEMPSRLLNSLDVLLVDWTEWVPTLVTTVREQRTWGLAFFWLIAILGITMIFLWKGRAKSPEPVRLGLKGHFALVVFLGMVFVTLSFFNVRFENGFAVSGGEAFAQDGNCLGPELGGFWVKGESQATLVIRTDRPISELSMMLQSPVEGKTTVRLGSKKQEWRRRSQDRAEQVIFFSSLQALRWKGTYLYTLQIEEEGGFYPYNIDLASRDKRFLGVFVRLDLNYSDTMPSSRPSK